MNESSPAPSRLPFYYFTFGLAHPLSGRYVRLQGGPEGTRKLMTRIFGGNWATQYASTDWNDVQIRATERGRAYMELDLGLPPVTREPQQGSNG